MSLRGRSFALDAEASARCAKKAKKEARHKPMEPAGGWPTDDKVLEELEQKAQNTFGVSLRDVRMIRNSSPGTWNNAKQKNCTAPMAKTCAAYVMTMCFSDEMVDTSIHCAWWWWPWAPIVSWWKRYGWGCWSGDEGFGKGKSGGVRPLLIALGFVGAVGAWVPGLALGETGRQALAMFLGCKKASLPAGLMVVPYYGSLISACFKALNLWLPLLRTTIVCTNRGSAVCTTLGYEEGATHCLLSGQVFLSKTCMENGITYDLDPSFLGHKKGAKLKYMLFFVHPALPLVNGRIVYWQIPHNEPTLGNDEATRRLWVKIQDASLLDYIKIASSKLNPQLATKAIVKTFKVNADIIKSGLDKKNADVRETCGYGCLGGLFELGQFAKALGLVEYDDGGNAVHIKPLEEDYFKRYGLPEADIVKLVTDLSASGVRRRAFTLRHRVVETASTSVIVQESSYAIDAALTVLSARTASNSKKKPPTAASREDDAFE